MTVRLSFEAFVQLQYAAELQRCESLLTDAEMYVLCLCTNFFKNLGVFFVMLKIASHMNVNVFFIYINMSIIIK